MCKIYFCLLLLSVYVGKLIKIFDTIWVSHNQSFIVNNLNE